jgi:OOP family OmpA-OmpF porin
MLISKKQRALIVASALLLGACATTSAPTGTPNGYVTDTRNAIVKDPYNLCWRTGYWTPALANCECDKDLLPKERCEPPAPRDARRASPSFPPRASCSAAVGSTWPARASTPSRPMRRIKSPNP